MRRTMTRSVGNALPALLIGALVASCAVNPVDAIKEISAGNPAAPYLGMSLPEVIACAGEPHARYDSGDNAENSYLSVQRRGAAGGHQNQDMDVCRQPSFQ